MPLEQLINNVKTDIIVFSPYALLVTAQIAPLILGAYKGMMQTTNLISEETFFLPALAINSLCTSASLTLDNKEKKIKTALFGLTIGAFLTPLEYGLGYTIGYYSGKLIY
ncbi:hypothetical protein HYX11_02740 [Candidatus Woesearchaeota archaeon]|nr:hypothetical protein [Candidatus Woesearchaeota archaeon]